MRTTYLYLDQRDLIDLSNDDKPVERKKLEVLLSSKRVKIVISFMHIIETWKYADRFERKKVALYADSLSPFWIINRDHLFKEEIRSALWEYLGVPATCYWPSKENEDLGSGLVKYSDGSEQYRFCPFRRSVIEAIGERFSYINQQKTSKISYLPESFTEMLEAIENNPSIPSMLAEIHQGYPEFVLSWRGKSKGSLPGKDEFLHYLASTIYTDPAVTSEIVDDFLRRLDIKKCPSLYCYLRIKDEINKDRLSTPYPSEMVDIMHIVALPYCDTYSTDKRIWDYIRRGGLKNTSFETERVRMMYAFKLLSDAIEFIESLLSD